MIANSSARSKQRSSLLRLYALSRVVQLAESTRRAHTCRRISRRIAAPDSIPSLTKSLIRPTLRELKPASPREKAALLINIRRLAHEEAVHLSKQRRARGMSPLLK